MYKYKSFASLIAFFILSTLFLSGCISKNENESTMKDETLTVDTETQTPTAIPTSTVAPTPTVAPTAESVEEELKFIISAKLDSKAISENLIKEKTEQSLVIYLPPSYYVSDIKYPVVYYLHGFGDPVGSYVNSNCSALNNAFTDSEKQFIVVEVDGQNSLGGSFYVNSPVIGKWEDYTTQEVVSYIDSNYRTIASSESRGICGFSMGGFGALNLALLHPDIYGAIYAMSPGIIADGKLTDALDTWRYDGQFKKAYSMAFAYNTVEPYDTIPTLDGSKEDNTIIAMWESGFEDWPEKLDSYLALNTPLRAIGLSYGTNDPYKWISEGTAYFSGLLDEQKIENTLFSFEGGHMQPPSSIQDHLVPFFTESLVW